LFRVVQQNTSCGHEEVLSSPVNTGMTYIVEP